MSGPGPYDPYRYEPGLIEFNGGFCVRLPSSTTSATLVTGRTLSLQCDYQAIDGFKSFYYYLLKFLGQTISPADLIQNHAHASSNNAPYDTIHVYSTKNIMTHIYDTDEKKYVHHKLCDGNYVVNFGMTNAVDRFTVLDDSRLEFSILAVRNIKMGRYNNNFYVWNTDEQVKSNIIIVDGFVPKINLVKKVYVQTDFGGREAKWVPDTTPQKLDSQQNLIPPTLSWKNQKPTTENTISVSNYLSVNPKDIDYYILVTDGKEGYTEFYDVHSHTYREGHKFKRLEDIVVAKNQKATLYAFTDHPICTVVDLKTEKLFR